MDSLMEGTRQGRERERREKLKSTNQRGLQKKKFDY
jgi:hypothetical protein